MPHRLRFVAGLLVYAASAGGIATPTTPAAVARGEVVRGAACVGAVIRARYPHEVSRRLIDNCVEENLQKRRDSDGFRLGVHMAAAYWTLRLPEDVPWRARAIAQH